jgi:hypothetical protein
LAFDDVVEPQTIFKGEQIWNPAAAGKGRRRRPSRTQLEAWTHKIAIVWQLLVPEADSCSAATMR